MLAFFEDYIRGLWLFMTKRNYHAKVKVIAWQNENWKIDHIRIKS